MNKMPVVIICAEVCSGILNFLEKELSQGYISTTNFGLKSNLDGDIDKETLYFIEHSHLDLHHRYDHLMAVLIHFKEWKEIRIISWGTSRLQNIAEVKAISEPKISFTSLEKPPSVRKNSDLFLLA